MKKPVSKNAIISSALVFCAFSITMVSIGFASAGMQGANVASSEKYSSSLTPNILPINGEYIISTTIREDFLKKGSEKIERKIFVGTKGYEFTTNKFINLGQDGKYSISGSLDNRTKIITIDNAKFIGDVETTSTQTKSLSTQAQEIKIKQRKVAVFLMDYQDTATQPFYPSTINEMMFGSGKFKSYFNEVSYGRQEISGDVFGWFTMPADVGNNACQANLETNVAPFIANSQIDITSYTNIVIITLCNGWTSYGLSNLGPQPYNINGTIYNKTVSWINTSANMWNNQTVVMTETMSGPHTLTNLEYILIHEFGHALGLHHVNGLLCEELLPTNNCTDEIFGNYYDVMGLAQNTFGLHLNAWEKAKLGWFTTNELKTITQSGIYTITDLASQDPLLTSNQAKAYKIKPTANSNKTPIWIEFRNASGFDGGINTPQNGGSFSGPPYNVGENKAGIMIYKEMPDSIYGGVLNPKTAKLMYLRGAPDIQNPNPYQVSLNPGQTYLEPRYGLTITTLSSLSQDKRRFQVTIDPNLQCTPLAPKFFKSPIIPPPATISPGQTFSVWTRLENMDYISCDVSDFSVSLGNVPNGVSQINFNLVNNNGFLSNLEPDDERTFNLQIYFGPNTPPGQYTLPITATNTNTGLSTTLELPITVI